MDHGPDDDDDDDADGDETEGDDDEDEDDGDDHADGDDPHDDEDDEDGGHRSREGVAKRFMDSSTAVTPLHRHPSLLWHSLANLHPVSPNAVCRIGDPRFLPTIATAVDEERDSAVHISANPIIISILISKPPPFWR